MRGSRHREELERFYLDSVDPWSYETHEEELDKYEATFMALSGRHFADVLEIGCSEGVFTRKLSSVADFVLGVDISATAIKRARDRCQDLTNVKFLEFDFISDTLEQRFDLIICSEVLYYVPYLDRIRVANRINGWLSDEGVLVLVHTHKEHSRDWLDMYSESGAEGLHALFTEALQMPVLAFHEHDTFQVMVLNRGHCLNRRKHELKLTAVHLIRSLPAVISFKWRQLKSLRN